MLIGEKVKETSTTISYHEENSGSYCVPKWEKIQRKSNKKRKCFFSLP